MPTTNISVQDLVQREVIYCVSSLVYTLTQENKLDEELAIDLWTGTINYDDAELAIKGNNAFVRKQDKHYGVYDEDLEEFIVNPDHNNKSDAIDEYFRYQNWDLDDYRSEVFEHWLVSSWLFKKLLLRCTDYIYGVVLLQEWRSLSVSILLKAEFCCC